MQMIARDDGSLKTVHEVPESTGAEGKIGGI